MNSVSTQIPYLALLHPQFWNYAEWKVHGHAGSRGSARLTSKQEPTWTEINQATLHNLGSMRRPLSLQATYHRQKPEAQACSRNHTARTR